MEDVVATAVKIAGGLRMIAKRAHAQTVIVGAAIIDQDLRNALVAKMQPVSKTLLERLFDGYGPLSSFSAKIDLCHALRIITKDMYADLTTIRKIRNAFAHSVALVNFDSPEILVLFKRFSAMPAGEMNCQALYMSKMGEIDSHLDEFIRANGGHPPAKEPK
jgi:DNA-binding MltR family transcriptional regulator